MKSEARSGSDRVVYRTEKLTMITILLPDSRLTVVRCGVNN